MTLSRVVVVLVLCVAWLELAVANNTAQFVIDDEDGLLTVPQLLRKHGYPVEEYQVPTEDGYWLTVHRIPPRSNSGKHPILMMHAMFSSSADFVITGPNHGLAYLLADHGYDIWLGNARGNRYSKFHKWLAVDSPEFWDFSFHEIGFYDVPAFTDYILKHTGFSKLQYIGFSQGAMFCFVPLSLRPEYNDKFIQLHVIAPPVYNYQSWNPNLKFSVTRRREIAKLLKSAGIFEVFPHRANQYYTYRLVCPPIRQKQCRALFSELYGADIERLDMQLFEIFQGHIPAGVSNKQILHTLQIFEDGIFRQYDYENGAQNLKAYGSTTVPVYDLSKVTAPVRTYYGLRDNVVNYLNMLQLERELPNVVGSYPVPDIMFNHVDCILAHNVKEVLNEEVVRNVESAERAASS